MTCTMRQRRISRNRLYSTSSDDTYDDDTLRSYFILFIMYNIFPDNCFINERSTPVASIGDISDKRFETSGYQKKK